MESGYQQRVRKNKGRKFNRKFSDKTQKERLIREINNF
jgi:hypothetical protein